VPIGMLLVGEAVTRDSYMQLTERMFGHFPMRPEDSPAGLILHSAGDSEGGFYVYDIWESREAVDAFLSGRLGPAVHEELGDSVTAPTPQFFEIETLVAAPGAAVA
jgi:hypothetical protein